MSEANALSAEELRRRLYHSLRDRGYVDSLKSQLRNKLVTELKQVGVEQPYQPQPKYCEEGSLLHKAANSLVADHLHRCHYDYSYSVFVPESGSAEDKLFTTRDLLQLLNISPHSNLYKHLAAHTADYYKKGFLWQLLCELSSQHGNSTRDSGAQTDAVRLPPPSSLEEELRKVDCYYTSIGDDHKARGLAVEERILEYQRQLDERARTEVKLEIARFKENELSRMRLEERERYRQEFEQARREMERTYQSKADALLERERHSIERLQKQQEIQERETFAQRQSILDEIEAVRQRESVLKRQEEVSNREKQLTEERMKSREELVKRREDLARKAEIEYEQKLRDEVQKYKLEEQSRCLERTTNLEFREAKAKDDQRRLDEELRGIYQVKDELREKRVHVNELEAELVKAKHDLISSQKQGELYSEKLREMVDYQITKEENAVLKNETESLKMRLAELNRDNVVERQKQEELLREMTERAGKPTPEIYLLQRELEKLRNELQQERAVSNHQKMQADKRLQDEIDRNQDMLRRFEEQTLQLKEMGHELQDVRQQWHGAKQALNNEVYRKPKTSLWNGSVSNTEGPPDLDPGLIYQTADPGLLYTAAEHGAHRDLDRAPLTPAKSDDYSYSMDLVEETKKRLRNLEREAEHLEHNYRNFQYRMTSLPPTNQEPSPVAIAMSSDRSRANLQNNCDASPMLSSSRQFQGSEFTPVKSSMHLRGSASRPMSSTPSRQLQPDAGEPLTPSRQGGYAGDPLMNASMSTVHSTPSRPVLESRTSTEHNKAQPLTMSDLEVRPGSPQPAALTEATPSETVADAGASPEQDRISPSGEEGTSSKTDAPSAQPASLHSTWKLQQEEHKRQAEVERQEREGREYEEERRKRQEREDREYEEERRKREEERRRREEEAWEREQQALAELQGLKKQAAETAQPTNEAKGEELKEEGQEDNLSIDPVMLSYMSRLKEQKEKEKQATTELMQKTVDTWNKGRKERSPSPSEEISIGDEEEKSDAGQGGQGGTDDEFW